MRGVIGLILLSTIYALLVNGRSRLLDDAVHPYVNAHAEASGNRFGDYHERGELDAGFRKEWNNDYGKGSIGIGGSISEDRGRHGGYSYQTGPNYSVNADARVEW
mmetsp:Transcript_14695/g.13189  ORF Transcript_14695/g.13189 Transcript_14695/m.13189 type:complete len:105 (+) Transcript_14695:78-392(+)